MKYIESFIKFEKQNNLFSLDIRGFKYWHYVRFVLYFDILNKKENLGQAHTNLSKEKYAKRLFLKLKQIPNFIFRNPMWYLKQKDLIVLNHPRKVKNGEHYECLYTDSFLDKLNHSYYVFEQPFLEKHYKPSKTNNVRFVDYIGFRVAIHNEFMKRIFKFSLNKAEREQIEELVDKLNSNFETNLESKKVINLVENLYLSYKANKKYYRKILDKVQPRMIVNLISYSVDRHVITELAKERGIPVIELQHGTMGKFHIAYNFVEKMELNTFPDYLFVFGEFWKDTTRLPIIDSKIKVVGWPYYEEKIRKYKYENKKNDTKKTILFVSQGTIGKKLSEMAVDISKKINDSNYRIIYKLHPGEYERWRTDYPWLINSNIEIIDTNNYDMHYYFAQADIQVGVYSTAIFEGLGYGLKTFIFKFYGHEYIGELYKNDLATLVLNSDEFASALEKIKNEDEETNFNVEYFWKENAIENIINEIDLIYNGK
ncbi:sialyltransferase [Bacillus sp. m3-13]|uniref:sialyltransferase n=1 Tax=Bacillus sp. m3-13 TaxID=406124 RepID=UPI0001E89E09|nr:sialyltransferase [Bacillus sp. m3-13]